MALTVAFRAARALMFSLILAPVLASFFSLRTHEWDNPVLRWIIRMYRRILATSMRHPLIPVTTCRFC